LLGWHYTRPRSSRVAPVQVRKSIAVLGFHSLSGRAEDAWLSTALSEMLSTELSGGETLRLVSGEEVTNLRLASPWSQTDTLDQGTTSRIGNALSSDMLVLGSYTILGNLDHAQIRIDARMQDARTGEILTEIAEIGSSQDLFRLVSRVGAKLRARLGVPPLQDSEEAGILASLPLDADAARFYALGLSKLRKFDALAAKDLLLQATAADPKFSLGHAMLARAWSQIGFEQKHREEAKKALDLGGDLPRAEYMLVEGEYNESIGNQEQAASVYHALYELFPDDVEYGLHFANAQIRAGHAAQALEVVRSLRALPAPSSDDPRIDLTEATAIKTSQPASLALIRSAIKKASAQGKKMVYALARRDECVNLLYSAHPEQASPVCEDAYEIFVSSGNRLGAADAIRLMGDYQGSVGQLDQAIASYQRALGLLKELGEHEKTGAILNNMAVDYANQGNLGRAEQLYRQAKTHFEQSGDKQNVATALSNIADILYLRGQLAPAAKTYQDTIDLIATIDHGEAWYPTYRLADLALTQGNLHQAKKLARQAVEAIRPTESSYPGLSQATIELGEALKAEGDLAGAREQFLAAQELQTKIGDQGLVQESQAELADLALEEKHPEQAESLIRTAIGEFEKEKSDPALASAYTILSHALLMENKVEEARTSISAAVKYSQTSSDPSLRFSAIIQRARVEAAGSHREAVPAVAFEELRSTIAAVKKLGYYNLETEARLALGELQLKSNSPAGRLTLTELAEEAQGRGFALIARRAQAALAASNVFAQNRPAR
jgi:eukaryotic-like serine/threonine-protein kinase